MPYNLTQRKSCFASILLLVVFTIGCNRPEYQLVKVDGELSIKGQPGAKVHIEFIPDMGVPGPTSSANTDPRGKFTLHVMARDGSSPLGVVVGNHRVTLSDLRLAESPDGRGVPIRFGPEYTIAGSTPLKQEVKPDQQTIRLQIP